MNKMKNLTRSKGTVKRSVLLSILLLSFSLTYNVFAQADSTAAAEAEAQPAEEASSGPYSESLVEQGQQLFSDNCQTCHKLDQKMVGPALKGVTDKRDHEWLVNWIHNSQKMVQSGDPEAVAIYEEYNKTAMQSFEGILDESQINAILSYVKYTEVGGGDKTVGPVEPGEPSEASGGGEGLGFVFMIILPVLLIILFILIVFISILKKYLSDKDDIPEDEKELIKPKFDVWAVLKSKAFIGICAFIFIACVLVGTVKGLFGVGVQLGYQPTQPIAFSHALHAGDLEIDCNYCHTGVRKSKNANIPSLNICMNCHSSVKSGPKYGEEEIAKVVDAYESGKPVEWVRVHNLPDLAYFNHAQHVKVAGLECEECHGPIKEMEEVRQFSTLTMGWCINCHRETEVTHAKDNDYYNRLNEYHKHKDGEMVVEDIGGLECARCHY